MKRFRRVVITGLGVVAPTGIGKEAFWSACLAGRSGIRHITRFDASQLLTRIAGEVPDFDPLPLGLTPAEIQILDRGTQFALSAANLAVEDSGLLATLDADQRERMGVFMGAAMCAGDEGEKMWIRFTDKGKHLPRLDSDRDAAYHVQSSSTLLLSFALANVIATHHSLHGPCAVFATGCSAGADAIGQAYWAIQEGYADKMLAGGSDSAITATGINVFSVMKALSTRNDAPEQASRPYDGQRDGFVMAEGAGVLVLEEREAALARHAHIYAEITGFVSNSNAYHMTALPEDGQPLQALLRQAMQETGIEPRHIGYINSHGSSTLFNERAETAAYKAVFGEHAYAIPISATKSMIGHTQGAASAIETLVTALALDRQHIPPTINQHHPDPQCDLDYVPNVARRASFDIAIAHSSGFGGVNSALVLARNVYDGAGDHKGPHPTQPIPRPYDERT
ncbi:MAG TPA: beta-ketoacyl-[acyl-carrier-protein] synthase family protein, partial [Ktedonobacteraceae bacterium]|nr:beta-ketoacyl-[acyl-carrier-protein] synthase family protein [Ktedonobacteraceae bacterium]